MALNQDESPKSVLVIGAGVFGLSTFHALLLSDRYKSTALTLLDTHLPDLGAVQSDPEGHATESTQNIHAGSIDSSRIIRSEYATPAYSRLAQEAQKAWRNGFGERRANVAGKQPDKVYWEGGIVIVAEGDQGSGYVRKAKENSERLGYQTTELVGEAEVCRAAGLETRTGDAASSEEVPLFGYSNEESGWANAGEAMKGLMEEVVVLARRRHEKIPGGQGQVTFVRGRVKSLLFSQTGDDVLGAIMEDGREVEASTTLLAAGAWSPALLDLRGRVTASGQVLAYLDLTDSEAASLERLKVLLNLTNGLFYIPPIKKPTATIHTSAPNNDQAGQWEFKVARHGFGYSNFVRLVPGPEPGQIDTLVSLPHSNFTPIPHEAETALRNYLTCILPSLATHPFSRTRICWYADTPSGDFLIDRHPRYASLALATGGSGHGYKFLPVLGGKVVEMLEGRLDEELKGLWRWRETAADGIWGTKDGSRGGREGMVLQEEWDQK